MKRITPGIYETRDGALVAVLEVRPTGFIEGQKLSWKPTRWRSGAHQTATWGPGGWWLGNDAPESPMDLVARVGSFV